jgi:8-oxo-dGTP pyrophosphatase MutT (NUDIX family)
MLPLESSIIKNRLREALSLALPGEKAHRLMLPHGRDLYPDAGKKDILQSSVLFLIFPDNGKLHTCLIKRPTAMRNHGGQIAFPGGRYEQSDKELVKTALRESFEEIGINDDQLDILGALTPIYIQVSNFMINPFIGWCDTLPHFKIDSREVDELYLIPIGKLLIHSTNEYRKVNTPRGNLDVPGFFIDPLFIWGATAMIISEFKEIFLPIANR